MCIVGAVVGVRRAGWLAARAAGQIVRLPESPDRPDSPVCIPGLAARRRSERRSLGAGRPSRSSAISGGLEQHGHRVLHVLLERVQPLRAAVTRVNNRDKRKRSGDIGHAVFAIHKRGEGGGEASSGADH